MDGRVVNCKSAIANVFNSISSSLNLTSQFFDAMMHVKSLLLFGCLYRSQASFSINEAWEYVKKGECFAVDFKLIFACWLTH